MLSDVHSGCVNVCSLTGVRLWELEGTQAFRRYDFWQTGEKSPWVPNADWKKIVTENYPGCGIFSKKEMAKRTAYADWRNMMRAITRCGSEVHFFQDGPLHASTVGSFDFGISKVMNASAERESAHHFQPQPTATNSITDLDLFATIPDDEDHDFWTTRP